MPMLCFLIQQNAQSLRAVRQEGNKRATREKPCYRGDALRETLDSTRKLLDLINTFSQVAGSKTNIAKSVALLYTNDKP